MGSVAAAMRNGVLPLPARTKTSIHRCPPFWKSATLRSSPVIARKIFRECRRGGDWQCDQTRQSRSGRVLNRKLLYLSLPEVLKNYFLRGRHYLVVTGTHGKTTTTALLTWIMDFAKREPSYMIGGIPRNFGQGARFNDSKCFVIEGDEYDTAFFDKRSKFIHYLPELPIVNNVEFDHADIFPDLDAIKLSFRRLVNLVPQNGMIVLNGDDKNCVEVTRDSLAPVVEVGFSKNLLNRSGMSVIRQKNRGRFAR